MAFIRYFLGDWSRATLQSTLSNWPNCRVRLISRAQLDIILILFVTLPSIHLTIKKKSVKTCYMSKCFSYSTVVCIKS